MHIHREPVFIVVVTQSPWRQPVILRSAPHRHHRSRRRPHTADRPRVNLPPQPRLQAPWCTAPGHSIRRFDGAWK